MPLAQEHDRRLLDRILAGNERALEDLVAREHAALCRIVRAVVRDPSLIEDIVQDSWVSILRALPSFEGRSSLRDAGEVCNALEITESNQRVLLHRARSRLRAALERYLGEQGSLDPEQAKEREAVQGEKQAGLGPRAQREAELG